MVERGSELSFQGSFFFFSGFLLRTLIPFMRAPPSRPKFLRKTPPPTSHWELDFSLWILGGHQHQSVTQACGITVKTNLPPLPWPLVTFPRGNYSCLFLQQQLLSWSLVWELLRCWWKVPRESSRKSGPWKAQKTYFRGKSLFFSGPLSLLRASLVVQLVKNLPVIRETWVRSLGWEDSPGEGKGYPFQYSGLENFMDCIVHGVSNSRTWLIDFHFHVPF